MPPDNMTPPQSPPSTRRFLRYFLGFGVGAMAALAPYFGLAGVPGFRTLLELIPYDLRDTLLPVAGALAGIVAVVVQWYGRERISPGSRKAAFLALLLGSVVLLGFFVHYHFENVVVVAFEGEKERVSFTVGSDPRPTREPCPVGISDASCIKLLTFNPARVRDFWGDESIRQGQKRLLFSYCFFFMAFGGLVGVVFLRDEQVHRA